MKHEKQKYYDSLLKQNIVTEQMLFAIVAVNEPKISKYAYLVKKYKNCDDEQDHGSNEGLFKQYIGVRNIICKTLKSKYTKAQIVERSKAVSQDDFPAQRIIDSVIEMLNSGSYQLLSTDS